MLTVIIIFLVAIPVIPMLLLTPALRYHLWAAKDEQVSFACRLSWLGGFVQGAFVLGHGLEIRLLGFKVNIGGRSSRPKDKTDKKVKVKPKKKKKRDKSFKYPFTVRETKLLLKDVLNHLRPQKVQLHVRGGFEDPYYTGLACALLNTVQLRSEDVQVELDFTADTISGSFLLEGRIRPIALVGIGLRTFTPVFCRKIKAIITRKKEVPTYAKG